MWRLHFSLHVSLPLLSSSIRTSQPQRSRAPGTASRLWPPSCPSCLGSRKTGWSCTIRTGIPPLLTHLTRPRETSRLKCEDTQTYPHSLKYTHAHAEMQMHTEILNFWKAILIRTWVQTRTHTCKDLTYTAPCFLQCALSDPILYLFTAAADRHGKKTVLLYIFAKTVLKRKNRGLTRLRLRKIFKWTKKL